mmetsp:Transcript_17893/g.43219  ORF Transcript_17893/g.43219 Transcript_17893/m.43219 type:complete len:263 (-) Transcript_17893:743-1531(-)
MVHAPLFFCSAPGAGIMGPSIPDPPDECRSALPSVGAFVYVSAPVREGFPARMERMKSDDGISSAVSRSLSRICNTLFKIFWRSAELTNMLTTRDLPLRHAMCRGVSAIRVVAQMSAWCSISTCTQRLRPLRAELCAGVHPSASARFGSAPFRSSSTHASTLLVRAAKCSGPHPSTSWAFGGARACMRSSTTSEFPDAHPLCSAVAFHSSTRVTSALCCRSDFTHPAWPLRDARCSGVHPCTDTGSGSTPLRRMRDVASACP